MNRSATLAPAAPAATETASRARRTLALAGLAHALHDGFTDMIYVLLPVWQAQFGLDYSALATPSRPVRGGPGGAPDALGHLARYLDARTILVLGTLLSSGGFVLAGAWFRCC